MAIALSGNKPDILIECKPNSGNTSKDFGQLNEYCFFNKEVKNSSLTAIVSYDK